MQQQYQDAMVVVRKFDKPGLFVTFTCNPGMLLHVDCFGMIVPPPARFTLRCPLPSTLSHLSHPLDSTRLVLNTAVCIARVAGDH